MKLSPSWLREFVDVPVDDRRLAEDLTAAGIAVEGVSGEGEAKATTRPSKWRSGRTALTR